MCAYIAMVKTYAIGRETLPEKKLRHGQLGGGVPPQRSHPGAWLAWEV